MLSTPAGDIQTGVTAVLCEARFIQIGDVGAVPNLAHVTTLSVEFRQELRNGRVLVCDMMILH